MSVIRHEFDKKRIEDTHFFRPYGDIMFVIRNESDFLEFFEYAVISFYKIGIKQGVEFIHVESPVPSQCKDDELEFLLL